MKQLKNINWKQEFKNYKKWVPNALTSSRILFTPIIILLGIKKQISLVILFSIIIAVTDCIDGKLARKWNTESELGAKLDAIADKFFAIGLCLSLTPIFPILWAVVILEMILAVCNLYFHYKSKKTESLWIGKVKTTILFIIIIMVISYHFLQQLDMITQGFIYVCMNLQVLCIIEYSFNFYDHMHPLTVENHQMHQAIMNETEKKQEELEKTIELDHLDHFIQKRKSRKSNHK